MDKDTVFIEGLLSRRGKNARVGLTNESSENSREIFPSAVSIVEGTPIGYGPSKRGPSDVAHKEISVSKWITEYKEDLSVDYLFKMLEVGIKDGLNKSTVVGPSVTGIRDIGEIHDNKDAYKFVLKHEEKIKSGEISIETVIDTYHDELIKGYEGTVGPIEEPTPIDPAEEPAPEPPIEAPSDGTDEEPKLPVPTDDDKDSGKIRELERQLEEKNEEISGLENEIQDYKTSQKDDDDRLETLVIKQEERRVIERFAYESQQERLERVGININRIIDEKGEVENNLEEKNDDLAKVHDNLNRVQDEAGRLEEKSSESSEKTEERRKRVGF